jgi:general L-amino acid transport system substrate-binding protein
MFRKLFVISVCLSSFSSFSSLGALAQGTLESVKKKKSVMCGVTGDLTGFSATDSQGNIVGLDADYCRAIAAAIGVEAKFKPLVANVRFTALQTGEVDVLTRNTTWNLGRDTKMNFDFPTVNYFDGQGFLVQKKLKVKSVLDLNGASICVQTGTTTEMNLAEFFKIKKLKYKPVVFASFADANQAYSSGRCDAYTTDASGLASVRMSLKNPADHVLLPEIISKEPLGPVTRHGDNNWTDIVRWVHFALLNAEEKGITAENVAEFLKSSDPEIKRMLGVEGTLGADMGLPAGWAKSAIAKVGNYGQIFERNVGAKSPLKIDRGLNALWNAKGLMYAPPFQ